MFKKNFVEFVELELKHTKVSIISIPVKIAD